MIICMSSCSVILFQNVDISDNTPSRGEEYDFCFRGIDLGLD